MSETAPPPAPPRNGCFFCGFGTALACLVLLVAVLWGSAQDLPAVRDRLEVALLVIGATQGVYVIPGAIWLGIRRRWRTLAGWLTAAALVFLLNASCFYLVTSGL